MSASTLSKAVAQQVSDYNIEANIIYRFTKYIDWPQNKKSGDFIIGIVGESPIYDQLKAYTSNKRVGTQKIVVTEFSSSADIYNCHMLFIADDASPKLRRIANITAGSPVLIISENSGLINKGSCINFITVNGHLKLEFNTKNIEQKKLKIADELLDLGVVIK